MKCRDPGLQWVTEY